MYSRIIGTGSYLPEKVLTNRRSGTHGRHLRRMDRHAHRNPGAAHRRATRRWRAIWRWRPRGRRSPRPESAPTDLGLIIVATTTPDMIFPSTACILQAKLGIRGCPAFDVQAVCSGFVYALPPRTCSCGRAHCRYALVVGTEVYSRILDWTDRSTCVLFGDGAGAVVLAASERPGSSRAKLHADGSHSQVLAFRARSARRAVRGKPFVTMEGNAVFKFAVKRAGRSGEEVLAAA